MNDPSKVREIVVRLMLARSPGKAERSLHVISNSVIVGLSWIQDTRYSKLSAERISWRPQTESVFVAGLHRKRQVQRDFQSEDQHQSQIPVSRNRIRSRTPWWDALCLSCWFVTSSVRRLTYNVVLFVYWSAELIKILSWNITNVLCQLFCSLCQLYCSKSKIDESFCWRNYLPDYCSMTLRW